MPSDLQKPARRDALALQQVHGWSTPTGTAQHDLAKALASQDIHQVGRHAAGRATRSNSHAVITGSFEST